MMHAMNPRSKTPVTEFFVGRWKVIVGVFVAGLILAVLLRGLLWQIVESFMLNVLPILFTPVILEISVGFAGLFVVLLFCHFRKKEEETEWVVVSQEELDAAAAIDSVIVPVGTSEERAGLVRVPVDSEDLVMIRKLMDGRLFAEAEQVFGRVSGEEMKRSLFVRLKIQLLLQMEQWEKMVGYAASQPASSPDMALACVEAARYFVKLRPSEKEKASKCLEIGKKLSVSAVVNAIDSEGALQKLA